MGQQVSINLIKLECDLALNVWLLMSREGDTRHGLLFYMVMD